MKTPSLNIGSRSRMFQWFAGVSLLMLAVSSPAQVFLQDDFESGLGAWQSISGGMAIDVSKNKIPTNGLQSVSTTSSLDKILRSFGGNDAVAPSAKVSVWIFDDGTTATRAYAEARSYTGTPITGTLDQLLCIGKYNSVTMAGEDSTASAINATYKARIAFGTPGGWFHLNLPGAPTRSNGWHFFEIERGVNADGTITLNFYVDKKLGRSFTGTTTWSPTWDTVGLGSVAAGSTTQSAWFDGVTALTNSPFISAQPQAVTINQGQTLNLSAQVVGLDNPFVYQWRKDGANIPGATNLNYSVVGADVTNSGIYTFYASNSLGTALSTNALVSINPLILITANPVGTRINLGESTTFTVAATGNGTLSYQWKKNGSNLVGKTDTTLTFDSAQISDRGSYTVVVTNDVGDPATTSSAAMLQVNTAPLLSTNNITISMAGTVAFRAPLADDYSTNGVPFQDFETYGNGVTKMFGSPNTAGLPADMTDSAFPRFTRVTNSYPGLHAGSKVLETKWTFNSTNSGWWLRLTTSDSTGTNLSFNPVMSAIQSLRFDMYTERDLRVAIGVREQNPTGPFGSNAGAPAGEPIRLVGIYDAARHPNRIVTSNTWTTLDFNIPIESEVPYIGTFSGNPQTNAVLSTNKVTLEMLDFAPTVEDDGSQSGLPIYPYNVYLDNFVVTPADPLNYTLDVGPSGAIIDPVTGLITWQPPGTGTYNFTVSAKDTGSFITADSGLTGTGSFTVTVINATPSPTKLNYTFNKPNVTMTWTNSSFGLQYSDVITGPWTDIAGATSGFSTNTAAAAKFFRLKY